MHSGRYRDAVAEYKDKMFDEGRQIFRHDTFGSEAFWSGKLRLHEAIAGERFGGAGHGLEPKDALKLGLKVDTGVLPRILGEAVKGGNVDLGDVKTTMELLKPMRWWASGRSSTATNWSPSASPARSATPPSMTRS